MLTLQGRREYVTLLREQGLSLRGACRLVGIHRASVAYKPRPDTDAPLLAQMQQVAVKHPRWGVRKVYHVLRRQQTVNHKRIQRLWKQAGLQVKARRRKKHKPPGVQAQSVVAERPNAVWSCDFIFDATEGGTKLKMLTVGDDFTRECFCIAVQTGFSAVQVRDELKRLVALHGAPDALRRDNGTELTATEMQTWMAETGITAAYIAPGSPWQNGFRESFQGRFRDECLSASLFHNVADAKTQTEAWRREYNEERPHQSLGGKTPNEYKRDWLTSQLQTTGD